MTPEHVLAFQKTITAPSSFLHPLAITLISIRKKKKIHENPVDYKTLTDWCYGHHQTGNVLSKQNMFYID